MKIKYILLSVVFSTLIIANPAHAQHGKTVGFGVTLGDPTGLTLKYWLNNSNAFDFGIGFQDDTIIYGDYLWHSWDIFSDVEKGMMGGYVGIGGRVEEKKKDDKIGIRTTAGIDYFFEKHPIELFLEIVPIFQIEPDTDTEFDLFFGVRFYVK